MSEKSTLGMSTRRGFLKGAATAAGLGALGALGVGTDPIAAMADEEVIADPLREGGRVSTAEVREAVDGAYQFLKDPGPIPESEITSTVECEILVVGSGMSGLPAAAYAATQGANVHVVEKSSRHGVSRTSCAGCNSQLGLEAGFPRYNYQELAGELWRMTGGFQSKLPNVMSYFRESGKFVDWASQALAPYGWMLTPSYSYLAYNGIVEGPFWNDYHGVAFVYACLDPGDDPNPEILDAFEAMLTDNGGQLHCNTRAVRIEREEGEGRVTGVITQDLVTGEYTRYNASAGVLLCAGDFQSDKEMLHRYAPWMEKCIHSMAEPGAVGDMHKAALWVGAAMDDVSAGDLFAFQNTQCNNWLRPGPEDPLYATNPMFQMFTADIWCPAFSGLPLLWVDSGGHRFTCEESVENIMTMGSAILSNPDGCMWTIYDSSTPDRLPEDWNNLATMGFFSCFAVNTLEQADKEVELGITKRFDTLEELAEGCGFDPQVFAETIERYNHLCDKGRDYDCAKSAKWLLKLQDPPFYATKTGVSSTSTRCGLKTDSRVRVLDTQSRIIPGLYAAGNNGGNFYGITYPGSLGCTGIGHGQCLAWLAVLDMLGQPFPSEVDPELEESMDAMMDAKVASEAYLPGYKPKYSEEELRQLLAVSYGQSA